MRALNGKTLLRTEWEGSHYRVQAYGRDHGGRVRYTWALEQRLNGEWTTTATFRGAERNAVLATAQQLNWASTV